MKLFRRHDRPTEDLTGRSAADLRAEIDRLDGTTDADERRRLIALRHHLGLALLAQAGTAPAHAEPDTAALPAQRLPEIPAADLTPGLLRAGILRDGCLLVRGLVDRADAEDLAAQIDRAFAERDRHAAGKRPRGGYYDEFVPAPGHGDLDDDRPWIAQGGGVLAADSPAVAATTLRLLRQASVDTLGEGYLGEPALLSAEKTTLRKAEPSVSGAWHQDGRFMGEVRALNLWLALSRCGDEAPGLDIVPRRLDELVPTGTAGAWMDTQVAEDKAHEAAGDIGVQRPVFEPGDALLFDELFLHQTGSDPAMPNPRYALESWFFGASAFPEAYRPIAV